MGSLLPGGWTELRRSNRRLALHARDELCRALGAAPPCPDEMIGSMAALPLPPGPDEAPDSALYTDPLQAQLLGGGGSRPRSSRGRRRPRRLIRISAQVYNRFEQYQLLAGALKALLAEAPVKPSLRPANA